MHDTLKPPKTQKKPGGRLSSRNASIAAATAAALVAALLIVVFLQKYRNELTAKTVPVSALVADKLIQKGASADTAGAQGLFSASKFKRDEVKAGALTDAAALKGQIAVADILPGQQLTGADFKPAGNGAVTQLGPDERAVTVNLDAQHSVGGQLASGDHVDILVGLKVGNGGTQGIRPVVKTLMQNILVLNAPPVPAAGAAQSSGAPAGAITLRISSRAAGLLAFGADQGQIWLSLRPQNGRNVDRPPLVYLEQVLAAGIAQSTRPATQVQR